MKKSSRFYLKYNPDNRWSFWTGKWWSLCSEISGQFTPKLGGQFDRLFQYHKKNDFKVLIEIQRIIVIDEISENGEVFCHYLEGPKIGKTYSYKIDDIVPAFLHSHHLSYLFDSPKLNPSEREINDDAGFDLYYHQGVHYAFNGVNIYEYEVENDKDHERKVVRPVSEGMGYVNKLQDFINLKETSKNLS